MVSISAPAQAASEPILLGSFGSSGSGAGQFSNANDLAVGPNGHVYVADAANQRIQEFTAEGVFVRSSVRSYFVSAVTVGYDGQVYAVDSMGSVLKYASDLQSYTEIRRSGGAFGIAVDRAGNLYLTDTGASRIEKLDSSGQLLATWSKATGDSRSFSSPYGIAVDGAGSVHVADYGNARVVKLDASGAFVSEMTQVGGGSLAGPYRVAADGQGRIAVTDIARARDSVSVFSADGALEATWDPSGPTYGVPYGVAFGSDGTIYVLNYYIDAVQMFRLSPAFGAFTPQVAGSGRVGDTLTVSASTTPEPASWAYAWTVAGSADVRSNTTTFTPTAADQGKTVTVSVTAKGTGGDPEDRTETATKAITGKVMDTTVTIVDSTPDSAPTAGDVLTVKADESTLPAGATASVRWGRLAGQDCVVAGAAADEYTVVAGDAGATLCAEVNYAAAGHESFTKTATASSTAVGAFTVASSAIDAKAPVVGQSVTASIDLADAPAGAKVTSWQWGVVAGGDCVAIAGADERTFAADVSDFEKVLCLTATVSAPHHLDAQVTVTVGAVGAGTFGQAPTVTLSDWAQVGVELSAEVTGGDPAGADRAYQWNLDGDPIDGATQAAFTPRASDEGHDLSVTVTSTVRGYVADVTTSNQVKIAAGRLSVPEPTFDTAHPRVGTAVSLPVDLAEAPEGAEAHWQWGTRNGAECVAIGGAEGDTFTPTSAQVGEPLCVVVSVTAPGYEPMEAIFTVENAVVRGTLPAMSAVLSSTSPKAGATLTASLLAGELPAGATTRVTWGHAATVEDCRPDEVAASFEVTGAMAGGVVCALVEVTAPGYAEWSTVLGAEVEKGLLQIAAPVLSTDRPAVGVAVSLPVDLSEAPEGAEVVRQWGVVDGTECVAIFGATGESFTPRADRVGQVLCADVSVTAARHFAFETTVVAENAVVQGTLTGMSVVLSSTTPAVGTTLTTWWMAAEFELGATTTVSWGHAATAEDCRPDEVAASFEVTRAMAGGVVCALVEVTTPGYADWSTVLSAEVEKGQLQIATPVLSTDRPAVGVAVSLPVDLSEAPEGAELVRQWGVVDGTECVAISGATGESFTPTADQVGQVLCADVSVTAARHFAFETTVVAENAVVRGTLPAIRAVVSPMAPKVGTKLTASTFSTALPAGAKTTVSWGYAVQGATCHPAKAAVSFSVTKAMAGRTVCALVTVTAPGYADWSTVVKTGLVKETAKVTVSPKKVRGAAKFTIRAQGLAPGQRYRISLRTKKVTGKADSRGRIVRKIRYKAGLVSKKRVITVRGYDSRGKVDYVKKVKVVHRAK
ncbi:NHL repeat-containing protein [Aeromicrobium duanguangcaii]|uniref:NHL repeat-containing protein n=1 Tax=Aeromicrobium duanguangcaii TaxID=2968086 RepID=UPI0020178447|nr:NHL repeat-containing protein [Aeromicrobium duanguangcaii]MCL3838335.1 NHL repeat-containing protein [Aeromicrobium duanguangcaii]